MSAERLPIFIHAWWRSSSTYVWSKLRQEKTFRCYYEPLNERLAALKPGAIAASSEAETSRSLRHPVQAENYFAEYAGLIASGSLRYSRDLAYARYLLRPDQTDTGLKVYLDGLISAAANARQRAVLCFCRSQMRSAWMKQNFGGLHVAQIRNPFDQWASFQVHPYFIQRMFNVALSVRAMHPRAFSRIEQFEEQAAALSRRHGERPSTFTLNRRDALALFLVIWMASALQAIAYCDYLLDVDRLSTDGVCRKAASDWFASLGGSVGFADCATPNKPGSQPGSRALEKAVEQAAAAIRSEASCLVISSKEAVTARLPALSAASRRVLERALI
jgi:hypothetical protein